MIALYILIGAVGIIILFFAYLWISTILDERQERRYWRNRTAAFDCVYKHLNDCKYWLNKDGHAPYREFFEWIMDKMKESASIKGDEIRLKVTEIIEKHNHMKHSTNS